MILSKRQNCSMQIITDIVRARMQEMIGVSMFMARGTMADVLGAFKEAFYRYNSAAPHEAQPRECVRYATRAMLLAAEYARQHGAYNDANYALMKAHFQVCFHVCNATCNM